MAVPKKKVSRSRRNMRRFAGGNKISPVTASKCSHCSSPIRLHRVCNQCGYYEGKEIVKKRERKMPA